MSELVGKEFEFEVEMDLETVWDALTTPAGLATWYADRAEVDATVGGELKVDWGTGPFAMGTFDVVEPPNRLRLVYGGSHVGTEEWLLTHDDGVTHVRLIHSLPVDEGTSWDDHYGDITRGWLLFHSTLAWVGRTVGRLGRESAVRTGDIADGAWGRVVRALGLEATPNAGQSLSIEGLPTADVLVAVDGLSVLLSFNDKATLLVDVEGPTLYTAAATYGDESEASTALLANIADLGEQLCDAAGAK